MPATASTFTMAAKAAGASCQQQQQEPCKKVFVSGCYDIMHAGHLQFFSEARALGDFLIVSFASDDVLAGKGAAREPIACAGPGWARQP